MASAIGSTEFEFEELTDIPLVSTSNKNVTINSKAQAAIGKLDKIRHDLTSFYVGESHARVIRDMILALAIGEHLLMLGDPGLGKSAMSRDLFARLTSAQQNVMTYFEILMNKSTDPSELAGPIDMEAYKKGTFRRQTSGMLPEATGAFVDEIYKSNSVALNFLLAALNERKFHNGGRATDIPLRTVIAASNEGPESDELNALHDRILFRHTILESPDGDVFVQMLQNIDARERGSWKWPHNAQISTEELDALTDFIDNVAMPSGIFIAFKELKDKLGKAGLSITPRRWGKCLSVLKGSAALAGRSSVTRSDFANLISVLAEKESDKVDIRKIISDMAQGPFLTKLNQYLCDSTSKRDSYLTMPEISEEQKKAKSRAGLAIKAELQKLIKSVNQVLREAQANGEDMDELKAVQHEIVGINQEVVNYLTIRIKGTLAVGDNSELDLEF